MLRFNKIIARNIHAYEELNFDLRKRGLTLVTGEVQSEEGATSNGAGKTRSFDMIPWAVWDTSTTGATKDELIRIGSDGGYVKILGSIDGKKLKIIRGRGHSKYENKLWVWLDGKPEHRSTDAETKKYLTDLIGYSYASFTNSTFFPQEASNFFAALTDAKRKDLLEQILGLLNISAAKKCAADDRKKYSKLLSSILSELSTSRAAFDTIEETKERLAKMHKEWVQEFKATKKNLTKEKKETKKEIDKLKKRNTKSKEGMIEKYRISLKKLKLKHKGLSTKAEELAQKHGNAAGYLMRMQEEMDELKDQMKKSIKAGAKCPTCKEKITQKTAKKLRKEFKKKIAVYEDELNSYGKDDRKDSVALKECHAKIDKLIVQEDTLEEQIAALNEEQKKSIKLKERLISKKNRLKEIKKRLTEMTDEKPPLLSQLEYQKKREVELSAKITELETKEHKLKKKLFTAEFWEQGFGDAGLKNILLESALQFLETEITNILGQVTHGVFSVKILSTKQLKTKQKGKKPKRMKIDFVIHKGDETRTYSQLSGGQRKRINIAALLALRKLAFLGSGHPTNILILDEVFEYLDAKGIESVLDIIKAANIESVFLISQRELSSEGFDSTVRVKYRNKVSKLEVS
jgi:DNA repair exonuclease SbcCD ATPase subunit